MKVQGMACTRAIWMCNSFFFFCSVRVYVLVLHCEGVTVVLVG